MAVFDLRPVVAPSLPNATPDYEKQYEDQYSNVLRLYFNQLDNFTRALTASGGGVGLSFPYFSGYQDGYTQLTVAIPNSTSTAAISVTSTAGFPSSGYIIIDQEIISYTTTTATTFDGTITRGVFSTTKSSHAVNAYVSEAAAVTSTTSAAMRLSTVISSNQITCTVPDTKIYFTNSGIYNIQFSVQLLNYTTSDDNVTVWFRKNGSDVANSASIEQVPPKHGSSPGAVILALNFMDTFVANDYVEIYWASTTGETVLATFPPGTSPTRPASPGLIVTVSFVSHT